MNTILLYTIAVLDAALILQLLQMGFAVWADPYISRRERSGLLIIAVLVLALLIQGQADYVIGEGLILAGTDTTLAATLISVTGYVLRPIVLALFIRLGDPDRKHLPVLILCAVNASVYIISIFFPVAVDFSGGGFRRGPLGYTCALVSFICLAYLILTSVRSYNNNGSITNFM